MKLRIKLLILFIVGSMLFIGWYCGIVLGDRELAYLFGLWSIIFLFFLCLWALSLIVRELKKSEAQWMRARRAPKDTYASLTPKGRFCKQCGKLVSVELGSCPNCGKKLE